MTKAVLIGLDAATLHLIDKYNKENVLPNIAALMEEGVTTEAFCALPPATSVNWNTVSTGAYPGTHAVVSMAMINSRDPLDSMRVDSPRNTAGWNTFGTRPKELARK